METKERLREIFIKYLADNCSFEEIKFLMEQFDTENREFLDQLVLNEFDQLSDQDELPALPVSIFRGIEERISGPVKQIKLWPRIALAIAATITLVFGIYLFNANRYAETKQVASESQSIVPGKQGATLILADGTQIKLNDAANGELAREAGVIVTKAANGQVIYEIKDQGKNESNPDKINTLSTANGETYQVILPDGSFVWLNAASRLTYPVSFSGKKERLVSLSGEAYFEIKKDKAHPFKVKSKEQEIEVLGTHFNVSCYEDEQLVKTTLLEGSVKISATEGTAVLKPGEQAILASGKTLTVVQADLESAIAWKNGYFAFSKEDLKTIMQRISRWYDVDIVYKDKLSDDDFTGKVSRFGKINEVLEVLELTGLVHFKIEGRRIIVMP
ncbi:FecR family protein [Pedobacter frigoris]|uniref:FecR family protein n=1 Tax=Pedobacter frigoris TaxID=2571272 RepID=UPI00292EC930|nr:FecR domain-containing protein [Pedobacter frigoris]